MTEETTNVVGDQGASAADAKDYVPSVEESEALIDDETADSESDEDEDEDDFEDDEDYDYEDEDEDEDEDDEEDK